MTKRFLDSLRFGRLLAIAAIVLITNTGAANAANCFVYQVNIQGVAASTLGGTQNFLVSQFAIVRDAGIRSNPLEFVLRSANDLNATGAVGDIELMTNSFFARNFGIASASFDLARVFVGDGIQFEIDSAQSFQLPPPNVFVAPNSVNSSLGGLCPPGFDNLAVLCQPFQQAPILQTAFLIPRQGGGRFFFPDGTFQFIQGDVNVLGFGLDNPNIQGQYQAGFAGPLVNTVQC
jgi:hypothetical protein